MNTIPCLPTLLIRLDCSPNHIKHLRLIRRVRGFVDGLNDGGDIISCETGDLSRGNDDRSDNNVLRDVQERLAGVFVRVEVNVDTVYPSQVPSGDSIRRGRRLIGRVVAEKLIKATCGDSRQALGLDPVLYQHEMDTTECEQIQTYNIGVDKSA